MYEVPVVVVDVSIILPIHNAEKWIEPCLDSVLAQTFSGSMELCICNDACTDGSMLKVNDYIKTLSKQNINVVITESSDGENAKPKGCGFAKNQAVKSSSGEYLCFLDADDVMQPERIKLQHDCATMREKNSLIGSQVTRIPVDSTLRYTKWINSLDNSQLYTQIYTSNGPTIVMPTWFCHRSVFNIVGGFDEGGKGVPEDYLFFLKFLHLKGRLHRVDKPLLMYRHHPNATTFSVSEFTIWDIRIRELERNVLSNWTSFTIWNAGKQGRKFYRDLTDENRKKVACFCDVDEKKIAKKVYIYELEKSTVKTRVPILHFSKANKPFVICVKLDLTGGAFEANLASLNLCEGEDYVVFS